MSLIDVTLITPDKHKLGERPPVEIARARIHLVVESAFSNLKGRTRLDHHLAKTLGGLVQRVAQRLLALTLAMLINSGPPRSWPPRPGDDLLAGVVGDQAHERGECSPRREQRPG